MSHFQWNGNVYPMPQGWDGLSIEDWFYQLEIVRDRLMHADEEHLQPIYDDRRNPLDPEEVLLIRVFGFRDGGHWVALARQRSGHNRTPAMGPGDYPRPHPAVQPWDDRAASIRRGRRAGGGCRRLSART